VLLSTGGDLPAPTLLVVAGPRGTALPGIATAGAPGSVLVREDFSDPLRGILPSAAPPGSILRYAQRR
jgi:hypothetical protein